MIFARDVPCVRDRPPVRTPDRSGCFHFLRHLRDALARSIQHEDVGSAAIAIRRERHATAIGRHRRVEVVRRAKGQLRGRASSNGQLVQVTERAEHERPAVRRRRHSRRRHLGGVDRDRAEGPLLVHTHGHQHEGRNQSDRRRRNPHQNSNCPLSRNCRGASTAVGLCRLAPKFVLIVDTALVLKMLKKSVITWKR